MSRLDELVNKLCPNGVQFRKLGEVCRFSKGQSLSKSDIGTGDYPIILYGELYTTYGNYIDIVKSGCKKEKALLGTLANKSDLLLPISSTTKEAKIGKASVLNVDGVRVGGDAIILSHNQNPGYLMHLINGAWFEKLKMKCVYGTTIMHLHPKELAEIYIPVPPIEVQCEVVRILDSFTELQNILDDEYNKRIQIYDSVLTVIFDDLYDACKLTRVSDVAKNQSIKNKGEICKDAFSITQSGLVRTSDFFKDAKVTSSDTSTYKIVKSGWFVYSPSRIDVGSIDYSKLGFDVIVTSLDVVFSIDENQIDKDYLLLFLMSKKGMFQILANRQGIEGTGRKTIPFENFGKVKIPLPSLAEQKAIVEKLSLLSNYNKTLKFEIEKRQIQYAYYRDKLLTFKELKA